jgi:hypothetical protein
VFLARALLFLSIWNGSVGLPFRSRRDSLLFMIKERLPRSGKRGSVVIDDGRRPSFFCVSSFLCVICLLRVLCAVRAVDIEVLKAEREIDVVITMNIETAKSFFLWCTIINYTVLLVWFLVFRSAHDWHYRLTTRWFHKLPVEQYDMVHLIGIAFFKIAIILFSLVPYIALCIISR